VQKPFFLTNQNKYNYKQVTTLNLDNKLMKTTIVHKTKPNKTKAWFKLPFTPSGQVKNWADIFYRSEDLHGAKEDIKLVPHFTQGYHITWLLISITVVTPCYLVQLTGAIWRVHEN